MADVHIPTFTEIIHQQQSDKGNTQNWTAARKTNYNHDGKCAVEMTEINGRSIQKYKDTDSRRPEASEPCLIGLQSSQVSSAVMMLMIDSASGEISYRKWHE